MDIKIEDYIEEEGAPTASTGSVKSPSSRMSEEHDEENPNVVSEQKTEAPAEAQSHNEISNFQKKYFFRNILLMTSV